MKERVEAVQPGDVIRALWLNKVGQAARREANRANADNIAGVTFQDFAADAGRRPERLALVRMLRHAVVRSHPDNDPDLQRNNALVLFWERPEGDFTREGGRTVTAMPCFGLPLVEGGVYLVRFDPASGFWVPLERRVTEVVRIINPVPDGDGMYEATIDRYNDQTLAWEDTGVGVLVIDGNA